MGKGVGKLSNWFTELPSGILIFEFKYLRPGRALYFARQIQYRLPVQTKFINKTYSKSHMPLKLSNQVSYHSFW